MMLTSILIPFLPKYYMFIYVALCIIYVAKNNISARDQIWDLSTFQDERLIHLDHWGMWWYLLMIFIEFQDRKFIWRAVWWTWEMYINSHKKHLHKDLALTTNITFNYLLSFTSVYSICYFNLSFATTNSLHKYIKTNRYQLSPDSAVKWCIN